MMGIEQKVQDFVSHNAKFKDISSGVFKKIAKGGAVSVSDAAQATDMLFDQVGSHLDKLAVPVVKPSPEEVLDMFKLADVDASATMDEKEFEAFFAKAVVFAATRAAKGLGQSYGIGILGGVAGVMVIKRTIRAIPVINWVGKPLLGLLPTIIVGPAVGIAATYAIKKFGIKALKERIFAPKKKEVPQFKSN